MDSDDNEKFIIGNILLWENKYIILGTPFNYLDILDIKNKAKVGVINNSEIMRSLDIIIIYIIIINNISKISFKISYISLIVIYIFLINIYYL